MPASVPVIDLMPWFSADETARAAVDAAPRPWRHSSWKLLHAITVS